MAADHSDMLQQLKCLYDCDKIYATVLLCYYQAVVQDSRIDQLAGLYTFGLQNNQHRYCTFESFVDQLGIELNSIGL